MWPMGLLFCSRLIVLEHRWSKYITLEGNYIEKKRWISTRNMLGWLLIDSPLYIILYINVFTCILRPGHFPLHNKHEGKHLLNMINAYGELHHGKIYL